MPGLYEGRWGCNKSQNVVSQCHHKRMKRVRGFPSGCALDGGESELLLLCTQLIDLWHSAVHGLDH